MKSLRNLLIQGKKVYTKNKTPGKSVYGEKLINFNGIEYRIWDPEKSKICAAFLKGLEIELKPEDKILYLGAASGTTISHLSDLLENGKIFGVEISARVLANLVLLSKERDNIFPILADANNPLEYVNIVPLVDVVFQDVAQKNQLEIFLKNCRIFLKESGIGILALKTRSIDVSKKPSDIHQAVLRELKNHFETVEFVNLEPFEKDHYAYLCKNFKMF
ncbi:MAG: fibrillarin-like rRNA/tRNA 2'-O-methyltransferase [Candidatus Woesearchaeota archaeon]